jgi:hypothetical protein
VYVVKRADKVATTAILIPCGPEEKHGMWYTQIGPYETVWGRPLTDNDICQELRRMEPWKVKHWAALVRLKEGIERADQQSIDTAREKLEAAMALKRQHDGGWEGVPKEDSGLIFNGIPLTWEQEMEIWQITLGDRANPNSPAESVLESQLARYVQGVRPVIWCDGTRLQPAFFCKTLESALYLTIVMSAGVGKQGWAVCPCCGVPFMRPRPNLVYIPGHGSRYRTRRSRLKKKAS